MSDTTFIPDGWAEASSVNVSDGPPSAWSRQLSTTVRTASIPSDVVTWPVTVSASMSRTDWPLWIWRALARLVATVVLPTPPFGLKIATMVARRAQLSASIGPLWRTGPLPSSTVWLRMSIASTRQRRDSAEYGRVKYSSSTAPPIGWVGQAIEGARRDDHERRDGAAALAQERVVLEGLVEVRLAVEDGHADVASVDEERLELVRLRDGDHLEAGRAQFGADGRRFL